MENVNIRSYAELKNLFSLLGNEYLFRGHADSSWKISSTLFRNPFIKNKADGEKFILNDFDKSIHLFEGGRKSAEDLIEKLAFIQHHGGPTRLIDFTYSSYIATYFAVRGMRDECSVFAIDYTSLLNATTKYLDKMSIDFAKAINNLIVEEIPVDLLTKINQTDFDFYTEKNQLKLKEGKDWGVFSKQFHELVYCKNLLQIYSAPNRLATKGEEEYYFLFNDVGSVSVMFKVEPFYQNARRMAQSGCFLCQNHIEISFDEILSRTNEYQEIKILKINIPLHLRDEILLDLRKMNISEQPLFSDLDGFIRSLGFNAEN